MSDEHIISIGNQLRTDLQNNDHYTAEPMFCLQILVRDVGYDPAYFDNKSWWNAEALEVAYDDDEDKPQDLEDQPGWDGPFGYKDRWETVMVALTQKGIDDYMRQDGHNVKRRAFRGKTRTFVESFYRCDEMIRVRNFLMESADGQQEDRIESLELANEALRGDVRRLCEILKEAAPEHPISQGLLTTTNKSTKETQ